MNDLDDDEPSGLPVRICSGGPSTYVELDLLIRRATEAEAAPDAAVLIVWPARRVNA